ncbi:Subtilase family protein [Clostridium cavendishii DSM 21758]|uniref:Subtilase family protein n=1 Tax=Clostridium cavendishii DSM 21758 TaxID=1121302 RepID=A0A1M6DCV9_9CLOT|nr:S8 family peptidase [Clostridium cavendishii]SHI70871.1 Subtilase family protein [Clostridium cavendishii DSM 21758]
MFEYFNSIELYSLGEINIGDYKLNEELNLLNKSRIEQKNMSFENIDDTTFFTLPGTIFATIEYQGDIKAAIKKIPNARVFIADKNRAIIAAQTNLEGLRKIFDELFDVIVYVVTILLHTLCDISPIEASGASSFYNSVYLPLDGQGITVGIIDTGIDYLNEEFINEDGTSKIISIWDQDIYTGKVPEGQYGGSEYTNEEINRAINAKKNGEDPYKIVPTKDKDGHGTNMASLIGARGVNPSLRGVAPRCNLAIVKLSPAVSAYRDEYGVYGDKVAYSTSVIFAAMKYLYELVPKIKTPMVILVPLGSNLGPRNGLSFIERYIDDISKVKGIAVIMPIGNQGDGSNHNSGIIESTGDVKDIELKIDKNQKNIKFEIWISKPDKVSLSIVSPSGEIIDRIPPTNNKITEIKFLYESTVMYIEYLIPETVSGEEKISIKARNIREGIWTFKLIGDLIIVGKYDAYLLERELLAPETKFLKFAPYITLTTPSSSSSAITVGYYNQNNDSIVKESGRGYTRDNRVKPEIVAGGVRAVVTTVGGGTQVITGSSVSAAIVAGCSALIFQWGIVNGNDSNLYASKLKTYLIGGTLKKTEDLYPNPEWGYGKIDVKAIFDNIRVIEEKHIESKEYYIGNLFIRLPV